MSFAKKSRGCIKTMVHLLFIRILQFPDTLCSDDESEGHQNDVDQVLVDFEINNTFLLFIFESTSNWRKPSYYMLKISITTFPLAVLFLILSYAACVVSNV